MDLGIDASRELSMLSVGVDNLLVYLQENHSFLPFVIRYEVEYSGSRSVLRLYAVGSNSVHQVLCIVAEGIYLSLSQSFSSGGGDYLKDDVLRLIEARILPYLYRLGYLLEDSGYQFLSVSRNKYGFDNSSLVLGS